MKALAAAQATLFVVLASLYGQHVQAHDEHSPNSAWFNGLRTPSGGHCCGQNGPDRLDWDCQELDSAHVHTAQVGTEYLQDSRLWRRGDNRWHPIPENVWLVPDEASPVMSYTVCVHWSPTMYGGGLIDNGQPQLLCAIKPSGW